MATVEKVSIALPTDMLTMVRKAVDGGDYASSSEVVREALREWKARRIAAVDAGAARPASAMRKSRPASVARGGATLDHRRVYDIGSRRLRELQNAVERLLKKFPE